MEHVVALVVKIFNGFLLSLDKAFFAIQPELLGRVGYTRACAYVYALISGFADTF